MHLSKQNRTKLEPRAVKCVLVGYGTHQKGYRCFDPLTRHMYVTMDCDFQEDSYYYHLSRQGEKQENDDLSGLTGNTGQIEQEDTGTETATETNVQPQPLPQTSTLSKDHHEVQSDSLADSVVERNEFVDEFIQESATDNEPITLEGSPPKYKLPSRSTRGVPPKRYDPEYEAHRSRYPINMET